MALEKSDIPDLAAAIANAMRGVLPGGEGGETRPGAEVGEREADEPKARAAHARKMKDLQAEEELVARIFKNRKDRDQAEEIAYKRQQAELRLQYDLDKLSKEQYEDKLRDLKTVRTKNILQKEANRLLFDQSKAIGGMLKMGEHPFFNVGNFIKLGKAMKTAFTSLKGAFSMLGGGLLGLLMAFVNAVIDMIFAVDKMESSIKKTTGATQAYARATTEAYDATMAFGGTPAKAEKAFKALYGTVTDFTSQGLVPYRQEMLQSLIILENFGVSQQDAAKAIQNSMKIFGESGRKATQTTLEMTKFAQEIGVPTSQLIGDFNQMAPSLAKLGQAGEKAFKDLARTAKATGMEMNKLLQMTDKFDTFEGAAEQAGKLNAALGTNAVNAMDLLTETDPVARFEMIRDAIMDTGLTFDDMSYYQRKFYADALGLGDVSDLAKMMSGDMSDLGDAGMKTTAEYAAMADESRKNMDLQERFKAALMGMIPVLTPVIDKLREMMAAFETEEGPIYDFIHTDLPAFVTALQDIPITLKSIGTTAMWVAGIWMGFKVLMAIMQPLIWANTMAMKLKTLADVSNAKAQVLLAPAVRATATQMLALGAAIALIGIGVGAAAYGLGTFVRAFKGMESDEIGAVAAALMSFAIAVGFMVLVLLKVAPAAGVAAGPLYAIGGAIALIGLGVGVAAFGLAELMKNMTGAKVANLGALSLGIVGLAGAISLLAAALIALTFGGVGLLVLKGVFSEIEESAKNVGPVLAPYTTILASLANIKGDGLDLMAKSLNQIKKNLIGLDVNKVEKLTAMLSAAEAVQLSAAAIGLNVQTAGATARISESRSAKGPSEAAPAQYNLSIDLSVDGTKFGNKVIQIIGNKVKEAATQ